MLDNQIGALTKDFVKSIKETDIYQKYYYQLGKIKKTPELFERVNEFRHRNFEIQNTSQINELYDKMDAFEKEYETFRESPVVDDFLRAELAFCRMMQEIYVIITEELNFE